VAKVGGVAFNLSGIEVMLANQQVKPVAQARLTVAGIVLVPVRAVLGGGKCDRSGEGRLGMTANLIDRAEANAIRLAERAVDGSGFGDTHLGAAHKCRDIGWIGIAIWSVACIRGGVWRHRFFPVVSTTIIFPEVL
jgi:hypothetical protein